MIIQSAWQKSFSFFKKSVVVEPSEAAISSDAGLLPIRQFDEAVGMTQSFIDALSDRRYQPSVVHGMDEMVRSRIYGILADYADQNDHDALRSDPVFKLIAGRSIDADDLASQPTLSRFENAIGVKSLRRLQDVLINQFIASFEEPPHRITLDIDPFDDPTHGQQQLALFHGFYGQYQYLPRAITCAENNLVVLICLLHGTASAALGAQDDLDYVVTRLQEAFPGVRILLRADSGFASPSMYQMSERLGIDYTIGIGMNPTLVKQSDSLFSHCKKEFDRTGEPQREFCAFWYKSRSWQAQRWVIVKCEASAAGTNRRAVVTNRPGAFVLFEATYDEYSDRGESENRNKELKCGLQADRLSDHRYMANLFRLYMHTLSYNLLARLRNVVANPLPESNQGEVPSEAFSGKQRRRHQNRRRREDPLGKGQPCTWRTRVIKVAARITESSRRVLVELSGSWPYLEHYGRVSDYAISFEAASLDSG